VLRLVSLLKDINFYIYSRGLHGSLKSYSETYKPEFKCGYEISRNDTVIFVFVHSTDGVYEYNIDRTTGKTELYLYQNFNEGNTRTH